MNAPVIKSLITSVALSLAIASPAFSVDTVADWEKILRSKITAKNTYPRNALNEGIEGTVKMKLIFAPTGQVRGVEIVGSSGNHLLDRSAMRVALQLHDMPSLPKGRSEMSVVVPVTFKLKDDA